MTRYTEFYNRAGMLGDHARARLMALPEGERFAVIEEHHRRTDAIAEAWGERGEVIDCHDVRFDEPATPDAAVLAANGGLTPREARDELSKSDDQEDAEEAAALFLESGE